MFLEITHNTFFLSLNFFLPKCKYEIHPPKNSFMWTFCFRKRNEKITPYHNLNCFPKLYNLVDGVHCAECWTNIENFPNYITNRFRCLTFTIRTLPPFHGTHLHNSHLILSKTTTHWNIWRKNHFISVQGLLQKNSCNQVEVQLKQLRMV